MVEYIKTVEEFDSIVCGTTLCGLWRVDFISQIAKAKELNKAVLVDYTASWCGPCKMIAPVLDKIAGAADPNQIEFYKVDVDDAAEIASRAGISAVCSFDGP